MSSRRSLNWAGCYNARDLGGLPLIGGGETRFGQLIRSGAGDFAEADAYGVRTVIDLRNDDERPAGLDALHIPLDAKEDHEFWDVWGTGPQFGTPLYYAPHLERHPERSAAVIKAIAQAPAGGVLFHCGGGRDRAGQIAVLVLAIAGVEPESIAADYALSPADDQTDAFLAERGTTGEQVILDTLASVDVEAILRRGGATEADFDAVRERLRP